jgi:hypothetical protein
MRPTWLIVLALAAPSPCWAADEPLGRLFFSPAQRAQLEEARRRNIRAEELASQAASRPKAPRSRHVTVNGLIMRNDGASMIWVNGKPVESRTADGLRVSPTASREAVVLRDAEKGRALRLKVGQRANLLTGAIEENYEARRAEAHAEEAAREAGSGPPTSEVSQRRPRKRAAPEDEPETPAASKGEPRAAVDAPEAAAVSPYPPAPGMESGTDANPSGGTGQ